MPETRRKFDPEFGAGAVRIVRETGRPCVQTGKGLKDPDTAASQITPDGPIDPAAI